MTSQEISEMLRSLADPSIAEHSQRFFKTGKGEYGEGDQFLGIRVPVLRTQAKKYKNTPLEEIQSLLRSAFHEARLFALLLLVQKFAKADKDEREKIYQLYLSNISCVNNWDLVDSSAHQILGVYLEDKDRHLLYELSKSDNLWARRIAIMSTFYFIKKDEFDDAIALSKQLLIDKEDLIHKAVGWMLREIGKRNLETLESFLKVHAKEMPRTMLRYAIEKLPEAKRKDYLSGSFSSAG
ncbi:MAG: DNA alkylation repair protein [Cyanobacteria bacterium J06635_15]